MDLYAPPYVTPDSPLSFVRGDTEKMQSGPLSATLLSVEPPQLAASVIVTNTLLTSDDDVILTCELMLPFQAIAVVHQFSGMEPLVL